MTIAILQTMTTQLTTNGRDADMDFMGQFMDTIGDYAEVNEYKWHKKPVGKKVCPFCSCVNVRAGVRHRRIVEGNVVRYEKIIKVCFGTDTSIEPITQ